MTTTIERADPGGETGPIEPVSPADPAPPADDRPRPIGRKTVDDRMSFFGAGAGSLALVWLLYNNVLPFSGKIGFFVLWYLAFIALYAVVTTMSHPGTEVVDRLMTTVMYAAATVVGAALVWTLVFIFVKGYPAIFGGSWFTGLHTNFFTQDMSGIHATDGLDHGGILHAIVGSLIILSIAVGISLPLGIGTAVFLTEVGGKFGSVVRTVVEAMTAVPDLLAGLFVYVVLLLIQDAPDKNGMAAAIAIAVTMT
ncbi:MAG: phosphate transport system permease protein, partial [Pseudonocardiales bacterium]|nr:phosphate transport system permease protein [Pseudonocardiales bacterium]